MDTVVKLLKNHEIIPYPNSLKMYVYIYVYIHICIFIILYK
jgi:hypothetical protein